MYSLSTSDAFPRLLKFFIPIVKLMVTGNNALIIKNEINEVSTSLQPVVGDKQPRARRTHDLMVSPCSSSSGGTWRFISVKSPLPRFAK